MAGKIRKIYNALVEGAAEGHSGASLYQFVKAECPKATSKRIVKASLRALTDPSIKDAALLRVIYALAIEHRLDPVEDLDRMPDDEDGELPGSPEQRSAAAEETPAAVSAARASRKK